MKKYIIAFCFLALASVGFSQNSAAPGTYQLMTTEVKSGEVFSSEILATIESSRKLSKVVILKIGNYTWVKILSENTINDPNFIPLSDEVIEISPNDASIMPIKKDDPTN